MWAYFFFLLFRQLFFVIWSRRRRRILIWSIVHNTDLFLLAVRERERERKAKYFSRVKIDWKNIDWKSWKWRQTNYISSILKISGSLLFARNISPGNIFPFLDVIIEVTIVDVFAVFLLLLIVFNENEIKKHSDDIAF